MRGGLGKACRACPGALAGAGAVPDPRPGGGGPRGRAIRASRLVGSAQPGRTTGLALLAPGRDAGGGPRSRRGSGARRPWPSSGPRQLDALAGAAPGPESPRARRRRMARPRAAVSERNGTAARHRAATADSPSGQARSQPARMSGRLGSPLRERPGNPCRTSRIARGNGPSHAFVNAVLSAIDTRVRCLEAMRPEQRARRRPGCGRAERCASRGGRTGEL